MFLIDRIILRFDDNTANGMHIVTIARNCTILPSLVVFTIKTIAKHIYLWNAFASGFIPSTIKASLYIGLWESKRDLPV